MTEIVFSVAAKVLEYFVAPVGQQLGYLFRDRWHSDDLRNKVQTLRAARDDVQITVDEARRSRGDEIRPIVQEWLNRVDQITGEAEEFLMKKEENRSCLNGWCPNLKSRYQLNREAQKKSQVIVEIQTARNFPDGVSRRVPARSVTFQDYESYESRASTLNKIMDALRDDKTKMIGVWGMGGVGKTTLLKQVGEEAKKKMLFTRQVYVDVSWTREAGDKFQQGISNIQEHIADMLGLKLEEKTIPARAGKLKQRLQKEKILIILDDIWKEVKLEEVGIPTSNSKDDDGDKSDCKLLLASREGDLLRRDMGVQECFQIQQLQREEAWNLFKKAAGDSVEVDHELRSIANEIVNQCEGLPIAIVTIARALKDASVAVWKNALDELSRPAAPTNIRGMEEKVRACLELSYNHQRSDEAKSLFLLCGSLSYGDIWMDDLLRYAMGFDFFYRIKSIEQARNKLFTLVGNLKDSSLLLDGEDHKGYFFGASRLLFMDADDHNKFVRMHDRVRDVAKYIASKHPHQFVVKEDDDPLMEDWSETHESKYISLNCKVVHDLPQRLACPKLQFFLFQNNNFFNRGVSLNIIPSTFFEGMNQLKVLDLSGMAFEALPSTLKCLANLRTLRLDWCKLEDITVIGQLQKLQVLSMAGSNIQQLPKEMGQLTNLRLLDLNHCSQLEVIPPNILSKLSRLECLFMKSSFSGWAAEEVSDGESDVCLSELNHLDHLIAIEVAIPNVKLVPKEDKFFQNLTRFSIFIGSSELYGGNQKTSRRLGLKGDDGSFLSRNGIDMLLKKTEELELSQLKNVCRCPIPIRSFDKLKTLVVEDCQELKFLFLLSTARGFPQLEEMTIRHCYAMQQIMAYERELEIIEDGHAGTNLQVFPKLRSLRLCCLYDLINLGIYSQGNLDIHLPFFSYQVSFSNLEELEFFYLHKLKEIWHHDQLPHDYLSHLRILRVEFCKELLNLIPHHMMQRLKNLKQIEVKNCEVLQHVFDLEGYDTNVEILPKLETLTLENLLGLKGAVICNNEKNDNTRGLFSRPIMPVSFHSLKNLSISFCGKEDKDVQESVNIPAKDGALFGEKVSFPNLEELKLNGLSMLEVIWHNNQLSLECFSKLRILSVYTCPRLISLIPSHLIKGFKNLKEVAVCNCNILECVFDIGGHNGDDGILPKIEIIKLEELPRVRLVICNSDKNDNTRYSSSPSKYKDFHNLKELHITNCGMLLDDMITSRYHNLEVLVLKSLPNWKEIDVGILQKVKVLRLEKLPKLSCMIWSDEKNATKRSCLPSPSIFKKFHNMMELRIIECPSIFKNFHNMKELRMIEFGVAEDLNITYNDELSNKKLPFIDEGACNYEAFESRASTFNKIMDAFRDHNINLIGIVGIGGVGKTTLVKQVALQAKQQHLFTKQVYIDLSWTRHSGKLQEDVIAKMLQLNKADQLKQALKKEKILIILDSIWKEIDLEKIGIPYSCNDDVGKESKTVLICRDGDLLSKYMMMGPQTCLHVETLPPEEAWTLFKKTAASALGGGDCDLVLELQEKNINIPEEEEVIRSTAIQIVEECEGLPLAIVTIAKALIKDYDQTQPQTRVSVWKNALEHLIRLRNNRNNCSAAAGTGGKKDVVYSCVEWSYTHLKKKDCDGDHHHHDLIKSLWLLCGSLSGYGYGDISLDHLLQYAIGLDLLGPIDFPLIEQARETLTESVEILKASSLLFRPDADDDKFVRMHDVVYDVARDIASKHPHHPLVVIREDDAVGLEEWSKSTDDESKSCTFLSLHRNDAPDQQLPQGLVCPELQFLLLRDNPSLNIPDTFFQGMTKLQVLDLSAMGFTELPSSLDSLANLQTLRLDRCFKLVGIAGIGKLKKLKVLSLAGSATKQLPDEMVQLSNLRLLDLNDCWKLKIIPRNILSSLSRLECLFMMKSFTKWAEAEVESNASLSELNHLSCLTTLYITIPDAKSLPKDIPLKNLTRYAVLMFNWPELRTNRTLRLDKVNRRLHLGNGINKLLERSEEVEISRLSDTNYVLHPSNSESFLELKHLKATQSPNIQYIIDPKDQELLEPEAFPLLESLALIDLGKLQGVWHGPIPIGSFRNLKSLNVEFCPKLRYLLLFSAAGALSQLENMTVRYCDGMQQIVAYETESEVKENEYVWTDFELFPNLRTLKLHHLPELINFSSEFEATSSNERSKGPFSRRKISFSKLEELELDDLPKLKDIWYHQLPCGSYNLQTLRAYRCPHLPNLVPSHLIQSFQNLKQIDVDDREFLENFMNLQGIDENVDILPKLQTLKLRDLQRWTEEW